MLLPRTHRALVSDQGLPAYLPGCRPIVTDLGHQYQAPIVTPSPRASGSVSSCDEDLAERGTLLPKVGMECTCMLGSSLQHTARPAAASSIWAGSRHGRPGFCVQDGTADPSRGFCTLKSKCCVSHRPCWFPRHLALLHTQRRTPEPGSGAASSTTAAAAAAAAAGATGGAAGAARAATPPPPPEAAPEAADAASPDVPRHRRTGQCKLHKSNIVGLCGWACPAGGCCVCVM